MIDYTIPRLRMAIIWRCRNELAERERVRGQARGEPQAQEVPPLARQCDERIQPLATDAQQAVVDIATRRSGRDRAAVEEHLNRARALAGRAEHEVDVLGLELDVDAGARDGGGGLGGDVPAAAVGELVDGERAAGGGAVVMPPRARPVEPALRSGRAQIGLRS